jgi:acyl carrier protein
VAARPDKSADDEENCLPVPVTEADIRDWCISYLQKTIDNPSITIGPDASFAELGLDSATSAYFIVELEEWLGAELRPELVFEYPTIAALAHVIANRESG